MTNNLPSGPKNIIDVIGSSKPPEDWLVPHRLSRGLWIIEGGEPHHRTTLLMQAAAAIAGGNGLFGGEAKPRNVVFVSYSRSEDGLAAGFNKLSVDLSALKKSLMVVVRPRISVDDLDEVLPQLDEDDLIIFDGVPIDGVPEDMKQGGWFELAILTLRDRYNVMISAQVDIRGKKRDFLSTLADGFVTLSYKGEYQKIEIIGRSVDVSHLIYNGARWEPVAFGDPSLEAMEILRVLEEASDRQMKLEDIATTLGEKNGPAFRKRLQRLEVRGIVRRVSFGVYQYPAPSSNQLGKPTDPDND